MLFIITLLLVVAAGFWFFNKTNLNTDYQVGQPIDSLNAVVVYYNGGVSNVAGRNTIDGYNLGLKYQCVEFVKRYYYEYLNHKMPNSYGHAKDFFNNNLSDGKYNKQRDLIQYTNPSLSKPMVNDLIVFDGYLFNQYGHIAIISKVSQDQIEIIQQNAGPLGTTREVIKLDNNNGLWKINNNRTLGWLRIK